MCYKELGSTFDSKFKNCEVDIQTKLLKFATFYVFKTICILLQDFSQSDRNEILT